MDCAKEALQQQRYDAIDQFSALFGSYTIGLMPPNQDASTYNLNGGNNDAKSSTSNTSRSRSAVSLIAERKSRGIYGTKGQAHALSPSTQFVASAMDRYLHRNDGDAVGGAIISVPALDLQSPFDQKQNAAGERNNEGAFSVLPSLGESSKQQRGNGKIPAMAASVLRYDDDDIYPTLPTVSPNLQVTNNISLPSPSNCPSKLLQEATTTATNIEFAAAKNFGRPISYTRSSIPHAPGVMIQSLFGSFSALVESRVKAWTLELLKHSLKNRDEDSRARLMSLLATNSIDMSAMVTTFKIEKKNLKTKKDNHNGGSAGGNNTGHSPYSRENCDLILPLNLEIDIDLKLQDKVINLHLNSLGTVAAAFHENTNLLTYFGYEIDAGSLVNGMIKEARIVVLKAVAKATSCNVQNLHTQGCPERSLSQLNLSNGSALLTSKKLVTNDYDSSSASHVTRKSSMSTFSSNEGTSLKRDRERSVTWDRSVNNLTRGQSAFKKPKRMNSLKRSIKSFGKPNSEFFQSSKNATFAEFGNLIKNPHLSKYGEQHTHKETTPKTHHLSTMNLGRAHTLNTLNRSFNSGGKNMNASFEASRSQSSVVSPSFSLLSSSHKLLRKPTFTELARNAKYSQAPARPQNSFLSNLRRTPTQLENALLRQTQHSPSRSSGGNAKWG